MTNRGQLRGRNFEGVRNARILIDSLRRSIKGAPRKVFLILDNLRVHHAQPVKVLLGEHTDAIEVFHLPSYPSERNPDGMANADTKQPLTKRTPSKPPHVTCAACNDNLRGFRSTSSMPQFAMPLDSCRLRPYRSAQARIRPAGVLAGWPLRPPP
ncbi:MAG: transposase [Burkholderiales bacterium]|nr:transposase [Burkholderiales bacterium]